MESHKVCYIVKIKKKEDAVGVKEQVPSGKTI